MKHAPIYQLKFPSGMWIDQSYESYKFNLKHFPNDVRIVYGEICQKTFEYSQRSELAQSVYDSAINWPTYVGDVECLILDAFDDEQAQWANNAHYYCSLKEELQTRTFLLLVAEALDS